MIDNKLEMKGALGPLHRFKHVRKYPSLCDCHADLHQRGSNLSVLRTSWLCTKVLWPKTVLCAWSLYATSCKWTKLHCTIFLLNIPAFGYTICSPLGKHTVDNNRPRNAAKAFLCSARKAARAAPFTHSDRVFAYHLLLWDSDPAEIQSED